MLHSGAGPRVTARATSRSGLWNTVTPAVPKMRSVGHRRVSSLRPQPRCQLSHRPSGQRIGRPSGQLSNHRKHPPRHFPSGQLHLLVALLPLPQCVLTNDATRVALVPHVPTLMGSAPPHTKISLNVDVNLCVRNRSTVIILNTFRGRTVLVTVTFSLLLDSCPL
jgi:hypothetical protein